MMLWFAVRGKQVFTCLVVGAWIACSFAVLERLSRYVTTPGFDAELVKSWPSSTKLVRHKGKFDLVVFLHSECSCSDATIDSLTTILTRTQQKPETQIVLVPPEADGNPESPQLTGTQIIIDRNAREVGVFHAKTSGQIYLFGPEGNLRFMGGITLGRGHRGPSIGADEVINIVNHDGYGKKTPVFGCALPAPRVGLEAAA